jgi:hypothetical protein
MAMNPYVVHNLIDTIDFLNHFVYQVVKYG